MTLLKTWQNIQLILHIHIKRLVILYIIKICARNISKFDFSCKTCNLTPAFFHIKNHQLTSHKTSQGQVTC